MPASRVSHRWTCSQWAARESARLVTVPVLAIFLLLAVRADACTELPAGSTFWVRLTAPISSYNARPGMPIHAFLLESPTCSNASAFPIKIPVEGHVVTAHRVGLGLWHETGTLEIEFDRLLPADRTPVEIHGRVLEIDNAREQVKKGVIHGIRATDTPQGTISSRLKYMPSIHLYPDPFLLSYKMLFPVFPRPKSVLSRAPIWRSCYLPPRISPPTSRSPLPPCCLTTKPPPAVHFPMA